MSYNYAEIENSFEKLLYEALFLAFRKQVW